VSCLVNTGKGVILAAGGRGIGGEGWKRGSFSGAGVMQGVKLVRADGIWWRCDIDFGLSRVVDVQSARPQGEDGTCRVGREISQEAIQTFLDAMQVPETDNSCPQAFYLESE
jgi:hypothetical protein